MSGETAKAESGWTIDTLAAHQAALRLADERFHSERDRRITEVSLEREKALKIKEQADRDALGLAREIQTYKDEKANELREQISRERGLYVTQPEVKAIVEKIEATVAPIAAYVQSQTGSASGRKDFWGYIVGAIGLLILIYKVFRP
jgi:hypothetical protein